jgi:predicted metal-binding protein
VIALAAPHKTTLMFGDLPPLESAADILQLAIQYHASADGLILRQERPDRLKKGILARIPPFPSSII